ncbi:MAG: aminoacyl-tRNA hydrolase [bacterium]|nr:aminoacyl-tRNA hydrolase [bacterium]
MGWVIVGLGNPGEEYEHTRHNTGRMGVEFFAKEAGFNGWHSDKKSKSTISTGLLEKTVVALLLPDTFMNKSGLAVAKLVKTPKAAERLVVVYDDLDLPLGTMKISYDRGSGGHKGLESVMRAVKTKRFTRIRIGVSPSTAAGNLRKPEGKRVVNNFILTKFSSVQMEELRRVLKRVAGALETIILSGPERAMNQFNTNN